MCSLSTDTLTQSTRNVGPHRAESGRAHRFGRVRKKMIDSDVPNFERHRQSAQSGLLPVSVVDRRRCARYVGAGDARSPGRACRTGFTRGSPGLGKRRHWGTGGGPGLSVITRICHSVQQGHSKVSQRGRGPSSLSDRLFAPRRDITPPPSAEGDPSVINIWHIRDLRGFFFCSKGYPIGLYSLYHTLPRYNTPAYLSRCA